MERLEAGSEVRMLIRLVEKWAELGNPTARVRLAQARAFLHLGLMDRAWVRLKEVGDNLGDDPEVLSLTAEMFIERGWPVRARKAIANALTKDPSNPRLHEQLRRSHQPPIQPPANARDIERTGSPAELLRLAERFLCAGSFLRARSILEKLRRQRGAWSGRVEDLLWGLEGDFITGVEHPVTAATAVMATAPLSEVGEMTDLSEITAHGDAVAQDHEHEHEHEEVAFPSLFRRVESPTPDPGHFGGEVTRISRLAQPNEAAEVLPSEETDAGATSEDVPMDTQIQVVVGKDSGGPLHRKRDPEDGHDLVQSLNLRRYRSSMGMGDLGPDLGGTDLDSDLADFLEDEQYLEEEDEDLIVMTRRESDSSELPDDLEIPAGPIQVIERPMGPPPSAPVPPTPPRARPGQPRPPDGVPAVAGSGVRRVSGPQRILAVGLVLTTLLALLFLADRLHGSFVARGVWDETAEVLASGDYRALLKEEVRLEALLKAKEEPRSTYLAAYAVLELVLYEEFTGGKPRFEAAHETTLEAATLGGSGELVALAAAWRATLLGDGVAASGILEQLDEDEAEVNYLRSRVAIARDGLVPGVAFARAAVEIEPDSPRYLLGLAQACQRAGDQDCVERAFAEASQVGPTLAMVRLASVTLGGGEAQARLGSLERFLGNPGPVAPRHQGRAFALSAELYYQLEDPLAAQQALEQALATDPDNPGLLYRVAAVHLASNRPLLARRDLTRCLELRPLDMACHTGLLQTRLDLDRVEQAEQAVADLPATLQEHPQVHLQRSWLAAAGRQEAEEALAHLEAYLAAGGSEDGEVQYLQGLAWSLQGETRRGITQLEEAAGVLSQEGDPLLRRLGPRALALAARFAGPIEGRLLAVEAIREGNDDAWVHVQLGQLEESGGNRRDASRHFERAVGLAPALALAHYHRGEFLLEDASRTLRKEAWESWRLYLEMKPTGPRAERVSSHLGFH